MESHRKKVAPKVTSLLQQAEALVEGRDFGGAMRSVESALRLSPEDSSILTFKNRVQADAVPYLAKFTRDDWAEFAERVTGDRVERAHHPHAL